MNNQKQNKYDQFKNLLNEIGTKKLVLLLLNKNELEILIIGQIS
jgi:hypothetical protein